MSEWLTDWINYKGVFRTAPASTSLLNTDAMLNVDALRESIFLFQCMPIMIWGPIFLFFLIKSFYENGIYDIWN